MLFIMFSWVYLKQIEPTFFYEFSNLGWACSSIWGGGFSYAIAKSESSFISNE